MALPLIFLAIIVHLFALIWRVSVSRECKIKDLSFLGPLIMCLAANGIAAWGFWQLTTVDPDPEGDYGLVLSVLSLLAAGAIAGNFAHTHQDAAEDEKYLSISLSATFAFLFYLVFGSVCFFSGLSQDMHSAQSASEIIPAVMFLILLANTVYDTWDWREEA